MTEAQGDIVIRLLVEIRDALVAMTGGGVVESEGCEHPDDRRIDVSTFHDRNHWVCGVCRFDSKHE